MEARRRAAVTIVDEPAQVVPHVVLSVGSWEAGIFGRRPVGRYESLALPGPLFS